MSDEGAGKRMRMSLLSHPTGCMVPQLCTAVNFFPSFAMDDAVCFPLHGRVGGFGAITEIAVLLAGISCGWVLNLVTAMVVVHSRLHKPAHLLSKTDSI